MACLAKKIGNNTESAGRQSAEQRVDARGHALKSFGQSDTMTASAMAAGGYGCLVSLMMIEARGLVAGY